MKRLEIQPWAAIHLPFSRTARRSVPALDHFSDTLLEPFMEIPAGEKWLFDNKPALTAVKNGLSQAAQGRVKSRGSFARFANDEID